MSYPELSVFVMYVVAMVGMIYVLQSDYGDDDG